MTIKYHTLIHFHLPTNFKIKAYMGHPDSGTSPVVAPCGGDLQGMALIFSWAAIWSEREKGVLCKRKEMRDEAAILKAFDDGGGDGWRQQQRKERRGGVGE